MRLCGDLPFLVPQSQCAPHGVVGISGSKWSAFVRVHLNYCVCYVLKSSVVTQWSELLSELESFLRERWLELQEYRTYLNSPSHYADMQA